MMFMVLTPIVITEKNQIIDIQVGNINCDVSKGGGGGRIETVVAYLSDYDPRVSSDVTITTPPGASNDVAVNTVGRELVPIVIKNSGLSNRIAIVRYQAFITKQHRQSV